MLQHLVEIYNQKKTIFAIYNNNYIMNTTKTIQSALISVFSKKV
jgi:phosphoribosylaminoimidazolecarboxamide formyltransferase/IMP cyclohydrolase